MAVRWAGLDQPSRHVWRPAITASNARAGFSKTATVRFSRPRSRRGTIDIRVGGEALLGERQEQAKASKYRSRPKRNSISPAGGLDLTNPSRAPSLAFYGGKRPEINYTFI